jgi:outer membrane receptor protein involved in Fe transport
VFNLRASYQIDKTFQVYARVNNVFDNHYATYGTFFDINAIPNLANNGAPFANPDSLSPALPRAFYAGLKATFEATLKRFPMQNHRSPRHDTNGDDTGL